MKKNHGKLTARNETLAKARKVKRNYPRLPMVEIIDAVFDNWDRTAPEQRDSVIAGRREKQTA